MSTLPLFPLNTVLFPGIPLSLHIFEERYKAMINACIDARHPFGVTLIREGVEAWGPLAVPHPVGCSAQIIKVERLEDDRLYVTAVGLERFRILSLSHDQPYLVGEVEQYPLEDDDADAVERAGDRLRPWVIRYLQTLADAGNVFFNASELPSDSHSLAYLGAYVLQIPMLKKQVLLATNPASKLLEALHDLYRQEIVLLRTLLTEDKIGEEAPFSVN